MSGTLRAAVAGGTGPQARGLTYSFALAGRSVVIGSRDAGRAQEKAEEVQRLGPRAHVVGDDAGALRLARQLEPPTAVLISLNRRYKTRLGVSVTRIPTQEASKA